MSGVTTFYLIRHGEAEVGTGAQLRMIGRTDVPLTLRGRIQATAIGIRLQHEPAYHAAYCSPARRALETFHHVAPPTTPIIINEQLREIDCGVADGLLISEVQERFSEHWKRNQIQADPEFRWPEGESYSDFRQRCLRAFESMARAHSDSTVLVVTHAGVITQVLNDIHGNSPALWSAHRVDNASLTILQWGESIRRVTTFNETAKETLVYNDSRAD